MKQHKLLMQKKHKLPSDWRKARAKRRTLQESTKKWQDQQLRVCTGQQLDLSRPCFVTALFEQKKQIHVIIIKKSDEDNGTRTRILVTTDYRMRYDVNTACDYRSKMQNVFLFLNKFGILLN